MTDQEIIDDAYEATIKQLYAVLFDAYLTTANASERNTALQRFQEGLRVAREVRDRAKRVLS